MSASELRAQAGDNLVATLGISSRTSTRRSSCAAYVGGTIFACRIESQQSTVAAKDWRRYDLVNTPHLVHELDATVATKIGESMRRMNLCFGSLDFIVMPMGSTCSSK